MPARCAAILSVKVDVLREEIMTRPHIAAISTASLLGSAIVNWRFGVASGATEPWLYLWGVVALGGLAFWFLTVPLFSAGLLLIISGFRNASARQALTGITILCGTWLALGAIFCFGDMSPG